MVHSSVWSTPSILSTVQSGPRITPLCSRTTLLDGPLRFTAVHNPLSPAQSTVHSALWSTVQVSPWSTPVYSSALSSPQSIPVHGLLQFRVQFSPFHSSLLRTGGGPPGVLFYKKKISIFLKNLNHFFSRSASKIHWGCHPLSFSNFC